MYQLEVIIEASANLMAALPRVEQGLASRDQPDMAEVSELGHEVVAQLASADYLNVISL